MKKINVIGYVRVSTEAQKENNSVIGQITHIKEYAKSNRMNVVYHLQDLGISGNFKNLDKDSHRLSFLEICVDKYIESHQIKAVLVTKMDRLTRSMKLYYGILHRLYVSKGVDILFTDEPHLNDKSDPITELLLAIWAWNAEQEHRNIHNRSHAGKLEKFKLMKQPFSGPPPFGYKWEGSTGKKVLEVDIKERDIVHQIYISYIEHLSVRKVVKDINKKKLKYRNDKPFGLGTIYTILTNPRYAGIITGPNGNVVKGDYAPIISLIKWQKVQDVLKNRKHPGRQPAGK